MKYSKEEVLQYISEEDVKFIRIAFCDLYGRQKNISIMPSELPRAFEVGIAIDGSAIEGFGDETHSDLLLHPDADTLTLLPWRPEHGKVVRMFSTITYPDGKPFECDTRGMLKRAVQQAEREGYSFFFGAEQEFYLFENDENGNPTVIPFDNAGYMDIAPDDKGENIRREVCLILEQMGIYPESSHHEEGPGQNEIDFRYSDPLTAADNCLTFRNVVNIVARRNGISANFSPKPLRNKPGNGFHINMSVRPNENSENLCYMIAGILEKAREMTMFLNPTEESYRRFGSDKAPTYISWSSENRSQLVRIPAASGQYRRAELRSPDPTSNPYIAFALMIYAGLEGIRNKTDLPNPADINFYTADESVLKKYEKLPENLDEACKIAIESKFIQKYVPDAVLEVYFKK